MPDGDAGPDRDVPASLDESGPEQGTPADEQVNVYEQRYNDLRPYADRQAQENAQYRDYLAQLADPDTAAEALAALGYEMDEDDDEYEEYDEDDLEGDDQRLQGEIEAIKEYLVAQEDAALDDEVVGLEQQYMDQQLDALEEEVGALPDEVANAIGNLAFAYPDSEGLPDVAAAYMTYAEASQAQQNAYLDSKQAAVLYEGTAGVDHVNLNDADARANAVASIIEAQRQVDEG